MKITAGRAESFLAGIGNDIHAVLLFGPDSGLARERALDLTARVAGTVNDPFAVAEINASELRSDPARLTDEACSIALTGKRRVVRVIGATDGTSAAMKGALAALENGTESANGPAPALIVAEAADLSPRSSLRKLVEGAKHGAAIGCYPDSGEGLERLIERTMKAEGLEIDGDARAWLAGQLGADRQLTRSELEKVVLFARGKSRVALADCRAVVGDSAGSEIDDVVLAAADGDAARVECGLSRAFQEGTSAVGVLRAAQRHFQRLHLVSGSVANGMGPDAALKLLRPPLFFKVADRFRAQSRRWSVDRLAMALELLTEAEIACKSTGRPDRLICARVLLQIAHAGRAGSR